MIEIRDVGNENEYMDDRLFATDQGEEWLIRNQEILNLKLPNFISDDDIPF